MAAISLYVDAAPNVYGSPDYPAWQAAAFAGAANGSFVNMANSAVATNAGTTNFAMEDVVVYSFGDLGSRLSWIYWIPGESKASLAGRLQISLSFDWDGVTYDAYQYYYGSTWLTPSNWQDYAGGVIGIAGWAWWGAAGVNTPQALAADLADWRQYQGDFTFNVRILNAAGGVAEASSLTSTYVPLPGTLALLGFGMAGIGLLRRRR